MCSTRPCPCRRTPPLASVATVAVTPAPRAWTHVPRSGTPRRSCTRSTCPSCRSWSGTVLCVHRIVARVEVERHQASVGARVVRVRRDPRRRRGCPRRWARPRSDRRSARRAASSRAACRTSREAVHDGPASPTTARPSAVRVAEPARRSRSPRPGLRVVRPLDAAVRLLRRDHEPVPRADVDVAVADRRRRR